MSREEVVENLGTIARSGTREFLRAIREAKAAAAPELIGQFGVGFYSSFMVADRITVVTRRAGTEEATRWESTGDGSYTIEAAERPAAGTTVTLHLKPQDEEDGLNDYTQAWVLKDIVKRYSDFVAYPIRLQDETLNSMKAIWAREQGHGHRGRAPRVLQAHHPRLERPARAPERAHGRRASRRARCSTSRRRRPSTCTTARAATAASRSTSSACSSWTTGGSCCRRTCASCAASCPRTTCRSTSRARSSRRTARSRPSASTWCDDSWPRSRR